MRKTRELLRLKHLGRSQRQIASSLCVAVGTVCGQLRRARDAGMTWERAQEMTDGELESAVFRDCGRNVAATRAAIDYGHVHGELHRDGVTLQLLWSEYLDRVAARGDGTKPYQYSQFCELYGAWRSRLQPSMRIVHRAGEKAFVDYSGKKPRLWDRVTGGGARGGALRDGARSEQLHVRGGDADNGCRTLWAPRSGGLNTSTVCPRCSCPISCAAR
ncbi:MAG: hypothetical protein RL685_3426 [Pseudomonadota bacterium]|jgi:transposase